MRKLALLLLCCAPFAVANAEEDINSGAWIFPGCQQSANGVRSVDAKQPTCLGAVRTFAYFASTLPPAQRSCPPTGITVGQEVKTVAQWMEQHPERLHEQFEALLVAAFRDAWPCK